MSAFSASMYAAYRPLPVYQRPKKQRPHSGSRSIRRPFQHSRTSSGSQPGRSSQDTDAAATGRPATASASSPAAAARAAAGDNGQGHEDSEDSEDDEDYDNHGAHGSSTGSSHLQSLQGPHDKRQPPSLAPPGPFPAPYIGLPVINQPHPRLPHAPAAHGTPTSESKHAAHAEQEHGKAPASVTRPVNLAFPRADSVSSTSATTSLSARTVTSTDPSASDKGLLSSKPFAFRNGRTYLNDPSLPYPLPSDLAELHRQSLRTLLLIQLFGGPVCSPALTTKPPQRVLEVGCGSGFWSMMCHRYFKSRGHSGISFTGIDVAPLAPGSANIAADSIKPDRDMKWKFVNHDLRQFPWPMPDDEFDLVMVKDMSFAVTNAQHPDMIDEYLRLLRPGGTLEIWDSDHSIRMLRPHVPSGGSSGEPNDEEEAASSLGAYIMTANTPLSAPTNPFLVEHNQWLSRALEVRDISTVPCTVIGPTLLQEAEVLVDVRSRRMAVPFSEIRWEREGVGGVVTKDGKSYMEMKGKGGPQQKLDKRSLTAGQAALRMTALLTVVQQIQALEPLLREVNGKSQDEWDAWQGKMMCNLMNEGGTSWGECLEVGAWWAQKRKKPA